MSDAKFRDLERRWEETGAVDDEAAYLVERVRVGTLAQGNLERAAQCGHGAAIVATGVRGPRDRNEFDQALEQLDHRAQVCAAAAAALLALPSWEAHESEFGAVQAAINVALHWLRKPSPEVVEASQRVAVAAREKAMVLRGPQAASPAEATADAASHTAMAVSRPRFAGHAIGCALYALDHSDYTTEEIHSAIGRAVGDHLIQRGLADGSATNSTREPS